MHFWLRYTAHCAEKIVCACLREGSASAEKGGTGGGGWGHLHGAVHMAAARFGCKRAMVSTLGLAA